MDAPILSARKLETHFAARGSFSQRLMGRSHGTVRAVDDVTLDIAPGEIFGLVGESGSGKTTLGRTLLKLADPTAGSVTFEGVDITDFNEDKMRPLRRRMQVVYQDPNASLNPAMRIIDAVAHPLKIHEIARSRAEIRERVVDILERVGLSPAESFLDKYPDDISGGQKQRVAIARALITSPSFLVLDEPVASLDMSVRARVLELLMSLRNEFNLTYLFITHDLATAKFLCNRIAIMYLGKIVEVGPSDEVYRDPKHPYTQSLLAAIPQPDPSKRALPVLPRGEIPDAAQPPAGCRFHPRCPQAVATCGWEPDDLTDALEERWAGTSEDRFESERALMKSLTIGERRVAVPASEQPVEAKRILEAVLASRPGMKAAVGDVRVEGADVVVTFPVPEEPPLRPVTGRDVACVLYK